MVKVRVRWTFVSIVFLGSRNESVLALRLSIKLKVLWIIFILIFRGPLVFHLKVCQIYVDFY